MLLSFNHTHDKVVDLMKSIVTDNYSWTAEEQVEDGEVKDGQDCGNDDDDVEAQEEEDETAEDIALAILSSDDES